MKTIQFKKPIPIKKKVFEDIGDFLHFLQKSNLVFKNDAISFPSARESKKEEANPNSELNSEDIELESKLSWDDTFKEIAKEKEDWSDFDVDLI